MTRFNKKNEKRSCQRSQSSVSSMNRCKKRGRSKKNVKLSMMARTKSADNELVNKIDKEIIKEKKKKTALNTINTIMRHTNNGNKKEQREALLLLSSKLNQFNKKMCQACQFRKCEIKEIINGKLITNQSDKCDKYDKYDNRTTKQWGKPMSSLDNKVRNIDTEYNESRRSATPPPPLEPSPQPQFKQLPSQSISNPQSFALGINNNNNNDNTRKTRNRVFCYATLKDFENE